ncbi:integrin alpha-PS2-like isoform X1 [Vespula maculifrons]|uniref:Integrin alpha-PS2-like isoform X1 n=1 Tax=Vespula maculifrons TaxID=7453 RepID=A0ABD2BW85_VESMC
MNCSTSHSDFAVPLRRCKQDAYSKIDRGRMRVPRKMTTRVLSRRTRWVTSRYRESVLFDKKSTLPNTENRKTSPTNALPTRTFDTSCRIPPGGPSREEYYYCISIRNNHVRNPSVPSSLTQIDNKTLQWFGATVSASSKDGGPIMFCENFTTETFLKNPILYERIEIQTQCGNVVGTHRASHNPLNSLKVWTQWDVRKKRTKNLFYVRLGILELR